MDPGTLVGITLAFGAIMLSVIMEGGNPAAIIAPPALLLVFVGTIGVSMATGTLKDAIGSLSSLPKAITGKVTSPDHAIAIVVEFAERARREGLLALEESAKTIDDPFLRKGIELAVDGTDSDELASILENEIRAFKASRKVAAKFFGDMGAFSPTLGIIGTVLGLIHVLENLSDPSKLGHLIAGAFIATLWGVLAANVFWLPISKKLARLSELEAHHMELAMEGVLSIQAGANPRTIEQKLLSYLDAKERPATKDRAA